MTFQLTTGVVQAAYDNQKDSDPAWREPIVQVLNVKKIVPQNAGQSPERYRLIISDGVHFIQAMLATQMNDKVVNGDIEKHSIIKLSNYICNTVQSKRIIIILNAEVLTGKNESLAKIGTPISVAPSENSTASNQSNNNGQPQQGTIPAKVNMLAQQQQPQQYMGNINQNNSAPTTNTNPYTGTSNMYGANFPPQGGNEGLGTVFPINILSPYQNKWTIKARVTNKSDIRTWSNQRGDGKLFSVVFTDGSGEIKATAFNDAVDKFYDLLEENKVYYISKAKIQTARKQFSNVENEYEMSLDQGTTIIECTDSTGNVPGIRYKFVGLSNLEQLEKDSFVDVIAIVKEIGEINSFVSKSTQKPMTKRDLTLVDESGFSIRLTLWGKQAEQFDHQDNPVIACKAVKIGDFGGRSLSAMSASTISINPDIPEGHRLRGWYDSVGGSVQFQAFAANAAPQGSIRKEDVKTIAQIKAENLGAGEKPDYFNLRATVLFLKTDGFSYPACPSADCNKKVFEDADAWRCEKCQRTYPSPDHRYIASISVADHTGQAWLQLFNESGEIIYGQKASELLELKENDETALQRLIQDRTFLTYNFTVRAKQERYQEETKVRMTIVRLSPIDPSTEIPNLLAQIESYGK